MKWKAGDRVQNRPEFANLWTDSAWGEKHKCHRGGIVIEVPKYAALNGHGTLLVEWDSLTGPKADPKAWQQWIHSDLLLREVSA